MTSWAAILSFICYVAIAQSISNEIASVHAPAVTAQAGEPGTFNLSVEIKEGYHIQSHEVKDELIPTTIQFNSLPGFTFTEVAFPPPKKFKLEGTESNLDVYDGKFNVKVSFTTDPKIRRGKHNPTGKFKYQACDSVRCLFPKSIDFSFNVEVK
jgi:hypothetical protein